MFNKENEIIELLNSKLSKILKIIFATWKEKTPPQLKINKTQLRSSSLQSLEVFICLDYSKASYSSDSNVKMFSREAKFFKLNTMFA